MASQVPGLLHPRPKAETRDEWRLVRAVQGDAPGAFREFVERYQVPIYSLLVALLGNTAMADVVAQEVFVEAYRSIRKFKSGESTLARLFRITVRLGIENSKGNTERPPDSARARVLELLHNVGEYERVFLVLREVQGYSVPALSKLFRVDESGIRVGLLKARSRLVDLMDMTPK